MGKSNIEVYFMIIKQTNTRVCLGSFVLGEQRYLFVRVFVGLQGLHDGELCIVLEPPRLLTENFPQHPQSQRSDHMLGE